MSKFFRILFGMKEKNRVETARPFFDKDDALPTALPTDDSSTETDPHELISADRPPQALNASELFAGRGAFVAKKLSGKTLGASAGGGRGGDSGRTKQNPIGDEFEV